MCVCVCVSMKFNVKLAITWNARAHTSNDALLLVTVLLKRYRTLDLSGCLCTSSLHHRRRQYMNPISTLTTYIHTCTSIYMYIHDMINVQSCICIIYVVYTLKSILRRYRALNIQHMLWAGKVFEIIILLVYTYVPAWAFLSTH